MAVANVPPVPLAETVPDHSGVGRLARYRARLEELERAAPAQIRAALAAALVARDDVARWPSTDNRAATADEVLEIAALDARLKAAADRVERAVGVPAMRALASAVPGTGQGWWWRLEDLLPRRSIWWTAAAAICFAAAVSLITEIARRFFSKGPDFTGALYTLVQAGLTLAAGSTLFGTGSNPLESWLDRRHFRRRFHPPIKALLAAGVLLIVITGFLLLPRVAGSYNRAGVSRMSEGSVGIAIQDFERALSLSPDFPQAHYNLGRAYDAVLDHDSAAVEYQKAIQGEPELYPAYNSLARLYIVDRNNASGALGLIDEALELTSRDEHRTREEVLQARFALLKNRGWANLVSGNHTQARADLTAALQLDPNRASTHCLLAQVDEKQQRPGTAEWELCLGYSYQAADVEPIWIAAAQDRLRRSTEVGK